MKTYIISDVHGCSDALRLIITKLSPDRAADRLILLGDLFDRGPDSWEVFQYVQELADAFGDRFVLIRGNHDDYLLREKLSFGDRLVWDRVGRKTTVKSFKRHGEKMESTVPWLRAHVVDYYVNDADDSRFQCVHAGLRTSPIETNDFHTMVHNHSVVQQNRYDGPLTIVGHIALERPTWFAGDGRTIRQLKENMWQELPEKGIICIDTGCGKGGRLMGMVVENGKFMLHSVDEDG